MTFRRFAQLQASSQPLVDRLTDALAHQSHVLWLVPGGSNITLAVAVMAALPADQLDRLTIMLTDERHGVWGHPDSNFQQLQQAGFDPRGAHFIPVLSPAEETLAATVARYNQVVTQQFAAADIIIGQFGMGADGHIAGILPHSPASQPTDQLVVGYDAGTYHRITLSFTALRQLASACVFAFGAEKRPALERLQTGVSLDDQPAQIIKQISYSLVCNDQLGDEL